MDAIEFAVPKVGRLTKTLADGTPRRKRCLRRWVSRLIRREVDIVFMADGLREILYDYERTLAAQVYEQSFWKNLANQIANGSQGQLGWYAWKASQMEKHLAGHVNSDWPAGGRIVEMAAGQSVLSHS